MKKKRSVVVACLLSAIQTGLGLLYVGKPLIAVVIPIAALLLFLLARVTGLVFQPFGILTLIVVLVGGWIGVIAWSGIAAHRAGEVTLRRFQRWYVYVAFAVAVSFAIHVALVHRAVWLGYETYRLPSASMADTLISGDYIVDDSWYYRGGREPLRGEIVICAYPQTRGVNYVRRVIGVPGDLVEMRSGQVLINGVPLNEPYVIPGHNKKASELNLRYQVQPESYFVMGDNRDMSYDSRYAGAVARDSISGHVRSIWFSYVSSAGVRSDRIGMPVQ